MRTRIVTTLMVMLVLTVSMATADDASFPTGNLSGSQDGKSSSATGSSPQRNGTGHANTPSESWWGRTTSGTAQFFRSAGNVLTFGLLDRDKSTSKTVSRYPAWEATPKKSPPKEDKQGSLFGSWFGNKPDSAPRTTTEFLNQDRPGNF